MLKKIFSWFESRIDPYPDFSNKPIPQNKFTAFLWFSLTGIKKWLVLLIIFGIIIGVFEAFLFQMMGWVVDFLNQDTPATLWTKHGTALLIFAVVMLISPLWSFLKSSVQYQTLIGVFPMRMRWWLHHLMLNQSMRFFQDEFAGRVSAKVMQTALAVRQVILTIADMAVYILVYLVTSLFILFSFDWLLAIPILLWLLALFLVMKLLVPKIAVVTQAQADARSLMTGRVTDTYANIQTVKLFSRNRNESQYAREAMDEFLVTVHQQMRLVTILDVTLYAINILLILSITALGIFLWSTSAISVGAVAASSALALRLNNMAFWIIMEMAMLFENIGIVRDGMKTFSVPPEIVDKPNTPDLVVTRGAIDFDHVNFSYVPEKPILENFNLKIKGGEKVGIVGRSGSGKSTLINLLLRFYEVNSGGIFIDGQNIAEVTQESLRKAIGMVTQDTSLLHRSIRDNIRYGAGEVTEDAIINAAKEAEAHDFIMDLTDKYGNHDYSTMVGERGVKLSGGQRQRIAISRVLLKNAPILILDEATSALDSEVEAAIQDTLHSLMAHKTVIAIAHRLSTIAAMDRLIVLDEGEIKEMGTHQELLAQNGLYAHLWARQSGGFLPED